MRDLVFRQVNCQNSEISSSLGFLPLNRLIKLKISKARWFILCLLTLYCCIWSFMNYSRITCFDNKLFKVPLWLKCKIIWLLCVLDVIASSIVQKYIFRGISGVFSGPYLVICSAIFKQAHYWICDKGLTHESLWSRLNFLLWISKNCSESKLYSFLMTTRSKDLDIGEWDLIRSIKSESFDWENFYEQRIGYSLYKAQNSDGGWSGI